MEIVTADLKNSARAVASTGSDQLLVLLLHTKLVCHENCISCHCFSCSHKHGPLPCLFKVSELLTRGVQQFPLWKVGLPNSGNNWCHRGEFVRQQVLLIWGKDKSWSFEAPAVFPSSCVTMWEREFGISFCLPRWMLWMSVFTDMACPELLSKGEKPGELI